ncbi:MAG: hypothetical protein F4206_16865 [Gammaproteobacteria bacterium]|nr:hypothetical protein [Gammaproteobacteria bacterium]MYG68380.1 hypothetical protein [Gammaproteobacteria bacterium]
MTWEAIWALPNINLTEPVEGSSFALVPPSDPRVEILTRTHPNFRIFINRFRDTYNNQIIPTLMLRRTDIPDALRKNEVATSFRDLIVASSVLYARSSQIIYNNTLDRVLYSSFFWIYPWMLDKNHEHLIAHLPTMLAINDVDQFCGCSSPDLHYLTLRRDDFDEFLLQELLLRWEARYVSENPKWSDVALFRSLHMANQACLVPAGADAVLHDYGRLVALWVSAFEILVHPGKKGRSDLESVLNILEQVTWEEKTLACRWYRIKNKGAIVQKNLACWLYEKLYSCRNDFLHGNPVTINTLLIPGSGRSLLFHAAVLYRLALTSFLDLKWKESMPSSEEQNVHIAYWEKYWKYMAPQIDCEKALKLSRISLDRQRQEKKKRQKNNFESGDTIPEGGDRS